MNKITSTTRIVVNVNYTDDQFGKHIRNEDVVRPHNHLFYLMCSPETQTWKLKSRADCPTYGTCPMCYKCGPTALSCDNCPIDNGFPTYCILTFREKILDSVTLGEILKTGNVTAQADRCVIPNMRKTAMLNRNRMWDVVELQLNSQCIQQTFFVPSNASKVNTVTLSSNPKPGSTQLPSAIKRIFVKYTVRPNNDHWGIIEDAELGEKLTAEIKEICRLRQIEATMQLATELEKTRDTLQLMLND